MDLTKLAEDLGFEQNEFMEIAELFVETAASDIDKLQSAFDERNVREVSEAAHSIKGASGSLGFQEIYEIAKMIEVRARESSLDGDQDALQSLNEKLGELAEILSSVR